jgi:AAA family ATP:ADP antiporter
MAMPQQGPGPAASFLSRLFAVEADEAPAVAAGVLMFFLLFAGYFMLRPVRETMGIAGGVQNRSGCSPAPSSPRSRSVRLSRAPT